MGLDDDDDDDDLLFVQLYTLAIRSDQGTTFMFRMVQSWPAGCVASGVESAVGTPWQVLSLVVTITNRTRFGMAENQHI